MLRWTFVRAVVVAGLLSGGQDVAGAISVVNPTEPHVYAAARVSDEWMQLEEIGGGESSFEAIT